MPTFFCTWLSLWSFLGPPAAHTSENIIAMQCIMGLLDSEITFACLCVQPLRLLWWWAVASVLAVAAVATGPGTVPAEGGAGGGAEGRVSQHSHSQIPWFHLLFLYSCIDVLASWWRQWSMVVHHYISSRSFLLPLWRTRSSGKRL